MSPLYLLNKARLIPSRVLNALRLHWPDAALRIADPIAEKFEQVALTKHSAEKREILDRQWGWVQRRDQLALLWMMDRLAERKGLRICELGVGLGHTSNRLVEYLRKIGCTELHYFGVDNLAFLGVAPRFEHECMKFISGDRSVMTECGTLDFAFIDGCHCAECVMADSLLAAKQVRVGGFMGFHDTAICAQYPFSLQGRNEFQHYSKDGQLQRPLSVLEGISSARLAWAGTWNLVLQVGDAQDWGGVRVYERTA